MPGFDWRLKDDEAAALATFVRKSWSNDAPAVTAADFTRLRQTTNESSAASTTPAKGG